MPSWTRCNSEPSRPPMSERCPTRPRSRIRDSERHRHRDLREVGQSGTRQWSPWNSTASTRRDVRPRSASEGQADVSDPWMRVGRPSPPGQDTITTTTQITAIASGSVGSAHERCSTRDGVCRCVADRRSVRRRRRGVRCSPQLVRLVVDTGVFSAALSRRRRPALAAYVAARSVAINCSDSRRAAVGALVATWGSSRRHRAATAISIDAALVSADGIFQRVPGHPPPGPLRTDR